MCRNESCPSGLGVTPALAPTSNCTRLLGMALFRSIDLVHNSQLNSLTSDCSCSLSWLTSGVFSGFRESSSIHGFQSTPPVIAGTSQAPQLVVTNEHIQVVRDFPDQSQAILPSAYILDGGLCLHQISVPMRKYARPNLNIR